MQSRSTPGMAPCSLLPDQEDAIATQVGRAPMAPGEARGCRGTLPWGARPGDLLLWGAQHPLVPHGRAGSALSSGELCHARGRRRFVVLVSGGLSFFGGFSLVC